MTNNHPISSYIFTYAELADIAAGRSVLSRSAIGYYLIHHMFGEEAGYACLLLLDSKIRLKKTVCLRHRHGEVRERIVAIIDREIKQFDSGYFVIAHNHYNNPLVPSPEDIFTTDMLIRRFSDGKIRFLEHYIISGSDYITLSDGNHQHLKCYTSSGSFDTERKG